MQTVTHFDLKLCVKIANDQNKNLIVIGALDYLCNVIPSDRITFYLSWLDKNDLRGKRFYDWFKSECKSSHIEMHKIIKSNLERLNLSDTKVIYGKDFI